MSGDFSSGKQQRPLHVGDRVRVRPLGEILSTLDAEGACDAIPFMPEMVRHCRGAFTVTKSAHKTCDPTGASHLRRIKANPVHLETRCDGGAHGGCQAQCLFFWHPRWLERIHDEQPALEEGAAEDSPELLQRGVLAAHSTPDEIRYRCHATELVRFSTPISTLEPTQYVRDVAFGNITARELFAFGGRAVFQTARRFLIPAKLWGWLKRIKRGGRPPTATSQAPEAPPLNLRIGEAVRVRHFAQILPTLDAGGRNRGLSYDPDMVRSAGKTFDVAQRVERVIDERTGKMLRIRKDCIILEGVECSGKLNAPRLFCPRGALLFWRESWLEKVETDEARASEPTPVAAAPNP